MNIVSLPTLQIAELIRSCNFSFHTKTLIRDSIFNVDVAIIHQLENEQEQRIIFLSEFSMWQEISVLELIPQTRDNFWVRELICKDEFGMSSSSIAQLHKKKIYKLFKNTKKYLTLILTSLSTDIPLPAHCFNFFGAMSFPPEIVIYPIKKIAFIYDPNNLKNSYKEVSYISQTLRKYFPKLEISLFASPLSEQMMDSFFFDYDMVHFAGHIDPKGLLIGENTYYNAKNLYKEKTHTKLLFLHGCTFDTTLLQEFIDSQIKSIIFFKEDQVDIMVDKETTLLFYVGLCLGYRLGDLISIYKNNKVRCYGWSHNSFQIS
jgi:hypothetical protein